MKSAKEALGFTVLVWLLPFVVAIDLPVGTAGLR